MLTEPQLKDPKLEKALIEGWHRWREERGKVEIAYLKALVKLIKAINKMDKK